MIHFLPPKFTHHRQPGIRGRRVVTRSLPPLVAVMMLSVLPSCLYNDVYSPPYGSRPQPSPVTFGSYGHSHGGYQRRCTSFSCRDPFCPRHGSRRSPPGYRHHSHSDDRSDRHRSSSSSNSDSKKSSKPRSESRSSSGSSKPEMHPRKRAIQERNRELDEKRGRGEPTSPRARKGRA